MAYNDGNGNTKTGDRFWAGPNVAGGNKGTMDRRTLNPSGPLADDGNGARGTTFQGTHNAGALKNQIGPNAAGQATQITKPT